MLYQEFETLCFVDKSALMDLGSDQEVAKEIIRHCKG